MPLDPQVMLGGLFLGALYGLAAIGFQLILGATGQVYLAYGHFWVAAAMLFPGLIALPGLPMPLAMLALTAAGLAVGGWLHPEALWRRADARYRGRAFFIITLGMALVIEDIGAHLWPLPRTALRWSPPPLVWGDLAVPPVKLVVLGMVLVVALLLSVFLKFNRHGKALRAWDRGAGAVWLVGATPRQLGELSLALGLGLAGLAGGFLSLSYTVAMQEGMAMSLRCLVLAVVGGHLSPWSVLLAGVGLGLGEAWIAQSAGAQWSPLLGYVLLLILLPLRELRPSA